MPGSNRKARVCRGQCKGALGITARKLLTMHHICSWDFVPACSLTRTGCMCELHVRPGYVVF